MSEKISSAMQETHEHYEEQLDVAIRFHNLSRLFELRRAVLSLVCQNYQPLTIHILTQRLSDIDRRSMLDGIASTILLNSRVALKTWNYPDEEPVDARSALLDIGLNKARGRYWAILDHDDTILPNAYTSLIKELRCSGAAIAFGAIAVKHAEVFQDALIVKSRNSRHFQGQTLVDLFRDNFCPIHSFVVDRARVAVEDLWFDHELCKLEDYDFLIRLCSKYPVSFELATQVVGDYYFKSDDSNTIYLSPDAPRSSINSWEEARDIVEARKKRLVLSATVQRMLGIQPADPHLTVARAANWLKDSP